jgi:hypothetical protein
MSERLPNYKTRGLKPYDFYFISPAITGYLATESFLTLHPDAWVIRSYHLDEAIQANDELGLLARHQDLMRRYRRVKFGFIQHNFIAGVTGPVSLAERMSAVCLPDRVVELVRDPKAALLAFMNDYRAVDWFDYTFRRLNFSWFQDYKFQLRLKDAPKPAAATPSHSVPGADEALDHSHKRIRFFETGMHYAPFFREWETLDSSELVPERIERLFRLVGVDATFTHPYFTLPMNRKAQRFMRNNEFRLDVYGHGVTARLCHAWDAALICDDIWMNLAEMEIGPAERAVGIGGPLALSVRRDNWHRVEAKIRRDLVASGRAEDFLRGELFPLWWENFLRADALLRPYELGDLEGPLMARARELLADDVERMVERHPRLEALWPSVPAFLG